MYQGFIFEEKNPDVEGRYYYCTDVELSVIT